MQDPIPCVQIGKKLVAIGRTPILVVSDLFRNAHPKFGKAFGFFVVSWPTTLNAILFSFSIEGPFSRQLHIVNLVTRLELSNHPIIRMI
jgi:hypothetical protein